MDAGSGPTFGDLLRRHRDAAGLTQEDLSERTGITPQAISLLERGERRRPHRYTVQRLAEALGIEGRNLTSFEAASRRPVARQASPEPSRPLPAPITSLVGREEEIASVTRLLRQKDVRLLTLTGPGGVGKTRLAVEVGGRLQDEFSDGAVFVSLAPVRERDLIPSVLAEALGIRNVADRNLEETLRQRLLNKHMLVILDNFEHLLAAAPLVAGLVSACPGLTVLVTSRSPLRLGGEHQFPVAPLPLTGSVPRDDPSRSPAVRLFDQRARAASPSYGLTAANVSTVLDICRRLDGLPLAIELAAARIKLFPPRALLKRLDRRLQVLAGGARDLPERQQTLRDTVAWSYDLLSAGERTLFARLAVFSGGCTLEAAEAVCTPERDGPESGDILESLAALVDDSLLVSRSETSDGDADAEPRFMMLETIREYAMERLESSGEAEALRRVHALYFLTLAESTQPEVSEPMLDEWLGVLGEEHDNLRAALGWAIRSREPDLGARLGLALWRFWAERYHLGEGRRWLEAVLALGEPEGEAGGLDPELSARRWAFLHLVTGILAAGQGDYDLAVELYEESLARYQNLGHKKGTSGPLRELGIVAYIQGDYERAIRLSEQALAVSREAGSAFASGLATCTLSDALREQGDVQRAKTLLEESLTSLRSKTYPLRVANALAVTLSRLGSIECETGSVGRAMELFREGLSLARRFGFTYDAMICLEGMARAKTIQGRPEDAARIMGLSALMRKEIGTTLTPISKLDHDHAVNAARAALGEDAFTAAWHKGHAMPLETAVADVLDIIR